MLLRKRSQTYKKLLERAKLPTLYNRRLQDIATLTYKVKNSLIPSYVSDIFVRKGTRCHHRNSDFEMPRFNTICYGKRSIRYQGPLSDILTFNRTTRELPSLQAFKAQLRKVDLTSQFENNNNCCNLCSMKILYIIYFNYFSNYLV